MFEGDLGQFSAKRAHGALVRNAAEDNNGAQFLHLVDSGCQKIPAGSYFARGRLVFRRYATHRIGDAAVDQFQSIIRMRGVFAARKAELMERFVKQDAGIVAGEWTAGPVGAL